MDIPLGLSGTVQTVYRAVLDATDPTVGSLAECTGLSAPDVRAALTDLERLSLVTVTERGVFRVLPPRAGFARLIAQAEQEVAARQTEISAAKAALVALSAEHDAVQDRESVIRLPTLEAVRSRLEELSQEAVSECASLNPGRAHLPDAMDASKPLNQEALERGVAIRCVYQESFRNDPPTLDYGRWLTGLGGETRTVPVVPLQMVLIDRAIALLPSDPEDHRAGALEIRSPGIVAALCALFDTVWGGAEPFAEERAAEPGVADGELTATEQELLRLLGAGHTDDSAARRLDVSVRTVRRMTADLMGRLGAHSRFEAGVRAARRGWL